MSETNGPSPQVQYLRALGHDEAADALSAADALIPTSEATHPGKDEQRAPEHPSHLAEAEAQVMLRALRESGVIAPD